jgi:glycosyltransferase involved in cell wall biosynthesis
MISRLVLVSGSFQPREGGAERQMREILQRLAAAGAEVFVITQVLAGSARREQLATSRVVIYRVGSLTALKRTPRLGQILFCLSAFCRLILIRPNAVVSLQFGSATTAASLGARAIRCEHVVRLTGGGSSMFRSEPVARAADPVGRRIVELVHRYSRARVVAPARHLLSDFRDSFPHADVPTFYMPNGVAMPSMSVTRSLDRNGVVWYARAGSEQSVDLFRRVVALCPELQFIVIGQSFDAASLKNVTFLGWRGDVYPVLSHARVALNTSVQEGMPNFALQAIVSGCRVVGGGNAGLRELQEDHPDHVKLFNLSSPEQAAAALRSAHAMSLPGPGSAVTADEAARKWSEMMQGTRA